MIGVSVEGDFAQDLCWTIAPLSATAEAGRLCSPRTCATLGTIRGGDRVSGGVERSETVLESSSLPAIGTGEGPLVYKPEAKTAITTLEGNPLFDYLCKNLRRG